jgi:hypothetical protein
MFSLYKKSSFDQNCVFNTAFESPHPDASNGVFLLINGVLEHFSDNKNQKSKKYLNQAFFVGSERVKQILDLKKRVFHVPGYFRNNKSMIFRPVEITHLPLSRVVSELSVPHKCQELL